MRIVRSAAAILISGAYNITGSETDNPAASVPWSALEASTDVAREWFSGPEDWPSTVMSADNKTEMDVVLKEPGHMPIAVVRGIYRYWFKKQEEGLAGFPLTFTQTRPEDKKKGKGKAIRQSRRKGPTAAIPKPPVENPAQPEFEKMNRRERLDCLLGMGGGKDDTTFYAVAKVACWVSGCSCDVVEH